MISLLDNLPFIHHDYIIRISDCTESMSNYNTSYTTKRFTDFVNCFLNFLFIMFV